MGHYYDPKVPIYEIIKKVEVALIDAFEVIRSKSNPAVFLYYKKQNEY